jgi:hypothetical protein
VRTPALLLAALVAGLAAAPAARGADVVGIADQSAAMFASPHFQRLDVQVSRLIVSYDAVMRGTFEVAEIDTWMAAARRAHVQPLVSFNHSRGCYDGHGVVRRKACRLPSVKRYRRAFGFFRRRYPRVSVYSPWNEINHVSQPTARRPKRAAQFYNVVRKNCRGCTIVAADVLDQRGVGRYLRRFRRHAKGRPRLWGLHNYRDTNHGTRKGTRAILRAVKGKVWLTETGGIVAFGRSLPYDPRRAARAERHMFRLARSSRRITRLYIYNWFGVPRTERFDSGLVDPLGEPRPAYRVVHRHLARPGGNPEPPPSDAPPPPPGPPPPEPPPPPPGGGDPPPPDEPAACEILPVACPLAGLGLG